MTILERGLLDDGISYSVFEEISTFCPLGIRFWDTVTDDQIRRDLIVRAWPETTRRPVSRAFRTRSDVYAFQGLPGLQRVEHPRTEPGEVTASPPVASPPATRPFVVEVIDTLRRFVPVAFLIDLPQPDRGVYLVQPPGSPDSAPPGFYLFSSPTRQRPPGTAVVRGELVHAISGRAAGHALLRVSIPGQPDRWGIADSLGRFAVAFPIPPLAQGFDQLSDSPMVATSPPGPPVSDRTWEVSLAVFSESSILGPLPGTTLPDYGRVFHQAPAEVVSNVLSPPSAPEPEWLGTLGYDGELVASTNGRTKLLIVTTGSPP